jgi:hypothetical protein
MPEELKEFAAIRFPGAPDTTGPMVHEWPSFATTLEGGKKVASSLKLPGRQSSMTVRHRAMPELAYSMPNVPARFRRMNLECFAFLAKESRRTWQIVLVARRPTLT